MIPVSRFIVPALSCVALVSAAHAAVIIPTEDNFIRSGSGSTNGTNPDNGLVLVGNTSATDSLRGLLEFNLSSVTGQTSTGSSLTFSISGKDTDTSSTSMTVGLYLVTTTDVNISTVTWTNKSAGNAWSTGGGAIGTDYSATPLAQLTLNPSTVVNGSQLIFSSSALDSALTNAAASGGSLIFALIATSEGSGTRNVLRIGAMEETNFPATAGPVLNYIPEPSTALAGGLGTLLLLARRRK